MKNNLFITTAFIIFSFIITPSALADVEQATMQVDGMTCPFCIYGIEKKLKSVEEVKDAEANLKSGTVDITFKENAVVSIKRLDKAVDDSGFTPGALEITASGTLEQDKLDDKEFPALKVSGSDQVFLLTGTKDHGQEEYITPEKLKELSDAAASNGGNITITGHVHQHPGDLPLALSVENFTPDAS
ncbi:MAG: heavy-metal-associated domain-containing protein [Thermodesulfobacteriota bacterium]